MIRRFIGGVMCVAVAAIVATAAPIQLELAAERGVQITAPHEWLQLLTSLGFDHVRIRAAQPGDQPRIENLGTAERPVYHALAILNSRHQLVLPGGTFTRGDRGPIKDYFERLSADGAESLTAPRGMFGLTEKELDAVFADLAQPIDFETEAQLPRAIIDRLQSKFKAKIVIDPQADRALRDAKPNEDELKGITAGTGLAITLRNYGLVLRPEKPRGKPLVYRVEAGGSPATTTLGKTADHAMPHWPVGWEPQQTPGRTAPSLFESLNAEIDGYSLEESLAAIAPRLKVPLYLDRATLAANRIEPAKIPVRLARTRTIYKRVIDRVLAQARLGSSLRVDEAGAAFLWVTR